MNLNQKKTIEPIEHNIKNVNSFKLYFALREHGASSSFTDSFFQVAIYSLLGLSILLLVMFLTDDRSIKHDYLAILVLLIVFITCVFILFTKLFIYLFKYPKFKNWQQRLSFKITGSEKLLINSELLKYLYWYEHCGLKINFNSACTEKTKDEVNLIIIDFIKKAEDVIANFKIYNHWQFENDKLFGYANNAVVGILQRSICIDLNNINIKYGGIDSVEITSSKKLIKIEHRDVSD
ncbi:MAG: hypothetical protein ABIP51_15735 [Bacteroidia bacterium]